MSNNLHPLFLKFRFKTSVNSSYISDPLNLHPLIAGVKYIKNGCEFLFLYALVTVSFLHWKNFEHLFFSNFFFPRFNLDHFLLEQEKFDYF